MKKVISLGEIMLRLTPPDYQKIVQTEAFEAYYGGSEANVAVSLASLGHHSAFVSKLPANSLGDAAIGHLRKYGVNVEDVVRGGDRLGIYFAENGISRRASQVLYDRLHSSMAEARLEDFDFHRILEGADWFHVSGITMAIGESGARITEAAMKIAKEKQITISFDFNYRSKLWTLEEAKAAYEKVLPYVDVCFAGHKDAAYILGIESNQLNENEPDTIKEIMMKMKDQYSLPIIASTIRSVHSASVNSLSGYALDQSGFINTAKCEFQILDRVGGGDAYVAAFIHSMLKGESMKSSVSFALAASVLKHTLRGDFSILSADEINAFEENSIQR
ncbi:sugar kinase [Bacillus sp. PAMC26568]|nr:sugar kinase [Bacillus sp. PAMC26568]